MSWDIFVQDTPPLARSVKEIPDDFDPKPIGKRLDLVARTREVVPNADSPLFVGCAYGTAEAVPLLPKTISQAEVKRVSKELTSLGKLQAVIPG
jgi:hypothetical protein